tara:strand:- start:80 stop:559 length:480 start_codon:yes stop_codon:yes gene_type:complete
MENQTDITIEINGEKTTETIQPRTLLVHLLRDKLGLTGTHIGCDTTQCGACTVLLDGKAIKSCTMFAFQAKNRKVTTIEGLGKTNNLHPVQQAFWEEHGLQCGYCTPGIIMTLVQVLKEHKNPTEEQIREGLAGNICRCTGYHNIVKAAMSAANQLRNK